MRTSLIRHLRGLNFFNTPTVTRLVAHPSGYWTIETERGDSVEVCLVSGWIIGNGLCTGLYWKSDAGDRFRCFLVGRRQDPLILRRLLVRLKLPV